MCTRDLGLEWVSGQSNARKAVTLGTTKAVTVNENKITRMTRSRRGNDLFT